MFSVYRKLEIAALLVACTFNERYSPLLKIMEALRIKIGPQAKIFVGQRDTNRLKYCRTSKLLRVTDS